MIIDFEAGRDHDDEPPGVDEAAELANAATYAEGRVADAHAIARLCKRLSAIGGLDDEEMLERLADMETPAGLLHCRVHDACTGELIGAVYCSPCAPLTTIEVLWTLQMTEQAETTPWSHVATIDGSPPGMLDLAVLFAGTLH